MARAYGSRAQMLLKKESSYGVAPTGNYLKLPFSGGDLGAMQGLQDDPVLGLGRDAQDAFRDVVEAGGDIPVPIDTRYIGVWLTGLFGAPTTTQVAASGSITFTVNPSAGDTITINGVSIGFVSGAAGANEIQIQADLDATLDEAVSVLNGSADTDIDDATYSHAALTDILVITHDTLGPAGNGFTLAATAASVSGATLLGGCYKHVFKSGSYSIPSYSIEVGNPEVPAYKMNNGVMMNTIGLDFQRSGAARASMNVVSQGEERASVSAGGTPSEMVLSRLSQFQGAIKLDGAALGNVTSASLTYSNNLETVGVIRNDGKIAGADPTIATMTGNINVRYSDNDLLALAESGTAVSLEFSYTENEGEKLVIKAHRVLLPKPKGSMDGPGGIEMSYDWQASKDATEGCMTTIELYNDEDGSNY